GCAGVLAAATGAAAVSFARRHGRKKTSAAVTPPAITITHIAIGGAAPAGCFYRRPPPGPGPGGFVGGGCLARRARPSRGRISRGQLAGGVPIPRGRAATRISRLTLRSANDRCSLPGGRGAGILDGGVSWSRCPDLNRGPTV